MYFEGWGRGHSVEVGLELKQLWESLRQEITQRNCIEFEERQTHQMDKRPVFLVTDSVGIGGSFWSTEP